jgi:hypothetical protein
MIKVLHNFATTIFTFSYFRIHIFSNTPLLWRFFWLAAGKPALIFRW